MKIVDSHKRVIYKALIYRVFAPLPTFLVAYLWTRDLTVSFSAGVIVEISKMAMYYLYEHLWNLSDFGREVILPEKGITLWFTGLPCSGKSTLAEAVGEHLKKTGHRVVLLDGDVVRKTICRDLGFSMEDRNKNIERITHVANLLSQNGTVVLTSFVSPYRAMREFARKEIGKDFIEVYTKCPVEVCIERDVKGMYKKALAGEIRNFTGISDPYEEPESPELTVETHREDIEQSTQRVINYLRIKGYLTKQI